jgi:peptidoglycan/xylan/chitin deacetylase (PgdA/CDA1 family)
MDPLLPDRMNQLDKERKSSMKKVPVIITCDLDPRPEVHLENKRKSLEITGSLFNEYNIPATFFLVGKMAEPYKHELKSFLYEGHEIGCHGMMHTAEEDFSKLTLNEARDVLNRATESISKVTGQRVVSFRGPRVKTSSVTQRALVELGYKADLSVCSQRLDLISSNLINPGWLVAPRMPYRPHRNSPYRRGKTPLAVIPLSAAGLPFISGILFVMGWAVIQALFRILYAESRTTGKPIVYLLHGAEFSRPFRKPLTTHSLKDFTKTGFTFRYHLKSRRSPEERIMLTRRLFRYIAGFPGVEFMTASQYVDRYFEVLNRE